MSFIWPIMLLSLLTIPLFVFLYLQVQRRRRRFAASFGNLGFAQEAAGSRIGLRRHIPPALFLMGLVSLSLAMARPQAVVRVPRIEGTVILAFDVSGSMAADDFKPTRMEAAKAAAQDFVQHQPPSVQIGVVAFSDSGFSVQAPTYEKEAVLASINRLAPAARHIPWKWDPALTQGDCRCEQRARPQSLQQPDTRAYPHPDTFAGGDVQTGGDCIAHRW